MKNINFLPLALLLGLSSQIFSMSKLLQKASNNTLTPTSVRAIHSDTHTWIRYKLVSKKFNYIHLTEALVSKKFNHIYFIEAKNKYPIIYALGIASERYPRTCPVITYCADSQPYHFKERYHANHPHLRVNNIQHNKDTTGLIIDVNTSLYVTESCVKSGIFTTTHNESLAYKISGLDEISKTS